MNIGTLTAPCASCGVPVSLSVLPRRQIIGGINCEACFWAKPHDGDRVVITKEGPEMGRIARVDAINTVGVVVELDGQFKFFRFNDIELKRAAA